jgi:hypothetical protein
MEVIMKKIILTATMILSIFILGCGGGTKDTADTAEKKSQPVKKVKKETVLTMKIGEEEFKFHKASFISEARTPADETTKYSLYGKLEGSDETDLYIKFDSAVQGEPQDASIKFQNKLENYEILESELNIENFEDRKHAVDFVKATFSGQVKQKDGDGEPINFEGSFIK